MEGAAKILERQLTLRFGPLPEATSTAVIRSVSLGATSAIPLCGTVRALRRLGKASPS